MKNQENKNHHKKFVFGNERFGGSYTPGEFEFNFPEDMSREDFERMFTSKMRALHKRSNDFADEFFENASKSRKENLKPLSIRVKPHTKEFFKKYSLLSPRDVLEIYENFNNSSDAFINSLLEDEKHLERELAEIQEKLRNAQLFKEKLVDIEPERDIPTDEDKLIKLQDKYQRTDIKSIGNETSVQKAKNDIIQSIKIYNTLDVRVSGNEYLILTVYTNAQPVLFYFKNEYRDEDILEIVNAVDEYCSENKIGFRKSEESDI
ncbi:hypothetical protein [uncultured Methanobrevibacter sp.]|uniref:hypothetical protein n=1 Tax=uncultured Methanobrevibacter sp. TaxID=253161 RepID=UPI0025E639ED|nr:hypothetical protein [uncultured Methanobrevibacter sp.]